MGFIEAGLVVKVAFIAVLYTVKLQSAASKFDTSLCCYWLLLNYCTIGEKGMKKGLAI